MTNFPNSFAVLFLIQLVCVTVVSLRFRRRIPLQLLILLSSMFVTVPVWSYLPLFDAGMIFVFDLVVPLLLLAELLTRGFALQLRPVAVIGGLVLFLPVFYAPIGYFFLDPNYVAYHTFLLVSVLYRSLLIFIAVAIVVRDIGFCDQRAVARLMAIQCLFLFAFGVLQYVGGLDLVVFERIKDTENVVDAMLSGNQKVLYGFGFLGLFRGAVPHMAAIGIFWWLVDYGERKVNGGKGYALIAMCLFSVVCVAGSLSRIGVVAMAGILLYAMFVIRPVRRLALLSLLIGLPLLYSSSYLDPLLSIAPDLMSDRFGVDQFTGQAGSGGTRIEAAQNFLGATQTSWMPWVIGVGGFNPITVNDLYGVYGMHSDYLEILARYGIFVGLIYAGLIAIVFARLLNGFFSRYPARHKIPRAFAALAIAIGILALTQGGVTFAGAAGYLAIAQTWVAIGFCIAVRGRAVSSRRVARLELTH